MQKKKQTGRFWAFFVFSYFGGPTRGREFCNFLKFFRNQKLNTHFFSQTFRAPPGYPSKLPGYPAQKVWFPWFRGTYRTFGPHPFMCKTPTPTENIRTQKFGFVLLFRAWFVGKHFLKHSGNTWCRKICMTDSLIQIYSGRPEKCWVIFCFLLGRTN